MNSTRSGFTLIELLILVVIVGLLAAITIPKFQAIRGRSYVSSMRADLHGLANLQDLYYGEHSSYSTDAAALDFSASEGVTVAFGEADSFGWSASAVHSALGPGRACGIYHGGAAPMTPARVISTVQCTG